MNAVDTYVVYDNIEYTKKGWFNRNRILLNGKDYLFTIPVKKDSDYLDVCERYVADDFKKEKLLNMFCEAYRKAPYYSNIYPAIEKMVLYRDTNLFKYIYNSICIVKELLGSIHYFVEYHYTAVRFFINKFIFCIKSSFHLFYKDI